MQAFRPDLEVWGVKGVNVKKILEPFLDLCVSSLREGHANLLCIVPILTDVAEATEEIGGAEHINSNVLSKL